MTREEAKELLPIIQSFVEGKAIQDKIEGVTDWIDTNEINFEFEGQKIIHRIKPESQYRPFKNQEECWNEMLKHQPFGWIRESNTKILYNISMIDDCYLSTQDQSKHLVDTLNIYEVLDGTPFGIKEE